MRGVSIRVYQQLQKVFLADARKIAAWINSLGR